VLMQVGDVTQTVEVLAQTPLLQPESSSLGQVIEARKVTEMPLNGRNPLALIALVPGVVPQGSRQDSSTGKSDRNKYFRLGQFSDRRWAGKSEHHILRWWLSTRELPEPARARSYPRCSAGIQGADKQSRT
jgi:hypothetical protein